LAVLKRARAAHPAALGSLVEAALAHTPLHLQATTRGSFMAARAGASPPTTALAVEKAAGTLLSCTWPKLFGFLKVHLFEKIFAKIHV